MAPFLGTNYYYGTTSVAALMASAGAVDSYAVGGNSPPVVADFVNEYYRVGGSDSTFATMFSGTTTRSDLATMVDSDEVIKWCPHNLCLESSTLGTTWTQTNVTVTDNSTTASDGTTTADTITTTSTSNPALQQTITHSTAHQATFEIEAKYVDSQWFRIFATGGTTISCWFDIQNGTKGTESNCTGAITSLGSGWYLCSVTYTPDNASKVYNLTLSSADNSSAEVIGSVYASRARSYRSSLGGMANNPDTGDSYVSTTTAAKYLQRRGHHVYNGSTWDNKGIQIETAARTNLETHSGIPDATFTKFQSTITDNAVASPDGGTNAATLTDNAGSGLHYVYHSNVFTPDGSSNYCGSVFVKAGTLSWVGIGFDTAGFPSSVAAYFNASTGAAGTAQANVVSSGIVDYGGGWYRIWVVATSDAAVASELNIYLANGDNSPSYSGSGQTMHVYGMQIEAGSTPSSYIPTSGATVSRAADSLTIPAANMSASTSNMSFQMDGVMTYPDDGGSFSFFNWRADASNRIVPYLETFGATTGTFNAFQAYTGTTDVVASAASYFAPGVNVAFNFAARHTSATMNAALDGTALTANAHGLGVPNLASSNCVFGDTVSGQSYNGTISQFRQWNVDLGDSGIATAST